MADTLTTLDEQAPVNTFLTVMFSMAVFTLGWIAIFAYQNSQLELLATGLAFIPLAIFMDWLSNGHIFRSNGSFGQLAFSFSLPILILEFFNLTGGLQFSVFSVASEGYLSSILASAPPSIQAAVNIFIAPVLETGVFVAVTLVLFRSMQFLFRHVYPFNIVPTGIDSVMAAFMAVQPAAYTFTKLHGDERGFWFSVAAYFVMNLMLLPGLFEDQIKTELIPFLGLGTSFIAGLHVALNMSNQGGLFSFFNTLLQVEGSVIVSHIGIIGFMLVSIVAGLGWFWKKTGGNFFRLRTIGRMIVSRLPF